MRFAAMVCGCGSGWGKGKGRRVRERGRAKNRRSPSANGRKAQGQLPKDWELATKASGRRGREGAGLAHARDMTL